MPLEETIVNPNSHVLWWGFLSGCRVNGPIVSYVKSVLNSMHQRTVLATPQCDCIMPHRSQVSISIGAEDVEQYKAIAGPGRNLIVTTLCTRRYYDSTVLMLPLDDDSFTEGVAAVVAKHLTQVPWEAKESRGIWRGTASGSEDGIRAEAFTALANDPRVDVRFSARAAVPQHLLALFPGEPHRVQGETIPLQRHADFKYIFVMDGCCIASSHQWVFASGSVPLILTHPSNDWWFRRYATPMVHYVPLAYDLSDLTSKLDWLIANDDEARKIAENAKKFADYYLSSAFQKYHIENEIRHIVRVNDLQKAT